MVKSLPVEIIIEILRVSTLVAEDLRTLSTVSPDFRIIAQQQLLRAPRPADNVALQRMIKFIKATGYERLPVEVFLSPRHRSKPLFKEFLALAPQVDTITLDATSPRAEFIDLSFLQKSSLTTLNLIRIEQDAGRGDSVALDLPFLRILRLADLRLPSSFDRWKLPELRRLDISDCRIPDAARLPPLLQLQVMRLSKTLLPDLVLPLNPTIAFPSLRKLTLEDCWVSGFDDLERFLPLIVPTLESTFLGLNLFQSNFNPPESVASNMLYDRFSLCPQLTFLAIPTDLLLPLDERHLPHTLKHLQLLPRKLSTRSSPTPAYPIGRKSRREIVQSIVAELEGLERLTIPLSSSVPHPELVECCRVHGVELLVDG